MIYIVAEDTTVKLELLTATPVEVSEQVRLQVVSLISWYDKNASNWSQCYDPSPPPSPPNCYHLVIIYLSAAPFALGVSSVNHKSNYFDLLFQTVIVPESVPASVGNTADFLIV